MLRRERGARRRHAPPPLLRKRIPGAGRHRARPPAAIARGLKPRDAPDGAVARCASAAQRERRGAREGQGVRCSSERAARVSRVSRIPASAECDRAACCHARAATGSRAGPSRGGRPTVPRNSRPSTAGSSRGAARPEPAAIQVKTHANCGGERTTRSPSTTRPHRLACRGDGAASKWGCSTDWKAREGREEADKGEGG